MTSKTTTVVPVAAGATALVDPGSAYELLVVNTGSVGLGLDRLSGSGGSGPTNLSAGNYNGGGPVVSDGIAVYVPLGVGASRQVYPTFPQPVTVHNPGGAAGQATVTTWSQ
jgi:hypothetical protein